MASASLPDVRLPDRGRNWRWWVCCLLLLATMINYMDRLTINQLKLTIERELALEPEIHYSYLEAWFGAAFALGAISFGFLVDRWNVFWVYPAALVAWSLFGFLSGLATDFASLLTCRILLGFFEAANWPCALRTTQRILPPADRSMGNSILQSGAALGAVLIPLVLLVLYDPDQPATWRTPFLVVGAGGTLWIFFWLASLRPADLALQPAPAVGSVDPNAPPPLPRAVFIRRFAVLIILVVTINMTWHYLRAWHPSYLGQAKEFTERQVNFFSAGYYIFTNLGALTAGFVALWLARHGFAIHTSRRLVFLCAALLTTLCLCIPFIHSTWVMVAMFLLVGFGALGVFPCYYSFSQDLTTRNQGKVTGTLGACCWAAMFFWQIAIGRLVRDTGSYAISFVIAGLAPMIGFVALLLLWGPVEERKKLEEEIPAPAPEAAGDERVTTQPAAQTTGS